MNKIELYLVKSSSGCYDDYREYNETIIYATLEAAEKRKKEIIDAHKPIPFPFDWCNEEEFEELRYDEENIGKITDEDIKIFEIWDANRYNIQDFNSAWVQTVELDLQSWREKQLKGLL